MPESPDYYRGKIDGLEFALKHYDGDVKNMKRQCHDQLSALPAPIEATPGADWDLVEKCEAALDTFARAYRISMQPFAIPDDEGARHWIPGAWPTVGNFKSANELLSAIHAARKARGK